MSPKILSYAEILKAMKAKVNPQNSRVEVLSIRRIRREEILLVLKKRGEVSKRSLEVRDLYEVVTREVVVAALCIALGKPACSGSVG